MHQRGYVAAMDGNLSVRLDDRHILATPTSMCKGMMKPADLVIVDMDGRHVSGRKSVSSEIAMHLLIYKMRPDVRGVVHAHPPTATGFAAAGMALNQPSGVRSGDWTRVNSFGQVRHARDTGTYERIGTADSTIRCHPHVEPWSGGIRR